MRKQRQIVFALYPGFETLDVTGPASVFNIADGETDRPAYNLKYASIDGASVTTNAGLTLSASRLQKLQLTSRDTFIVPGADLAPLTDALAEGRLVRAIEKHASAAGRTASVCSGAFLLAEAGLLNNKRATSHWQATSELQKRYPKIKVEPDALYTTDKKIWTSAGVTTGIDMALAMVRDDLGTEVMRKTAQRMVIHSQRAGSQSQFSSLLTAQTSSNGEFSDLIAWMHENMAAPITVPDLAGRCGMSDRNFHRKFTQAVGDTPAKFLDSLRMQHAKDLLETGRRVKTVATETGFKSESGFRNAFEAQFGLSPSVYVSINTVKM